MKAILLAMWLCIGAVPAFADQNGQGQNNNQQDQNNNDQGRRGAPAPFIGLGVPAALAVGGVLLGSKLLKSRR
jgi:hypothetical protein